jgi:hypothetical protein
MINERLQELYDAVYEYTNIIDDTALNILDEVVEERGVESICVDFLNEVDISAENEELLAAAFIEAAERCNDEADLCNDEY